MSLWIIGGLIAVAIFVLTIVWGHKPHQHRHKECFGGLYADEPGGPKTYHEIWWECECGDVIDPKAKARAEFCAKYQITYIKPGEYPTAECYFA
jgi:hypothetical protein